jgi:flagellar biosynthetic protein FliO
MSPQAAELPGVGASLATSLVSLGVVCLLAWLLLRWLAKRGGGFAGGGAGPIRVLARCPLEPRRSLYLVEVAGRGFLVGVGEGGAMTTLGEVDVTKLPAARPADAQGTRPFADVLAAVLRRGRDPGSVVTAEPSASAERGPTP